MPAHAAGAGSGTGPRPMGENTAEMTAIATAVASPRNPPQTAPDGPLTASGALDLVSVPAERLAALVAAVDAAADLAGRWELDSDAAAADAGWWLFGARARGWSDAVYGAASQLRDVLRPARRGPLSSREEVGPRPTTKIAVIDAVTAAIRAHEALTPAQRASRHGKLPFEAAQAAINVVAPAAHDAAIARARGLLLDHGQRDAAALLRQLEQR